MQDYCLVVALLCIGVAWLGHKTFGFLSFSFGAGHFLGANGLSLTAMLGTIVLRAPHAPCLHLQGPSIFSLTL